MIRMGRGNREGGTDYPEQQQPTGQPAYRYTEETQGAVARGAISESEIP